MFNKIGQTLKDKPWLWVIIFLIGFSMPMVTLTCAISLLIVCITVYVIKEKLEDDRASSDDIRRGHP